MKTDLELIKKEIGAEKLGTNLLSVSERLDKLSDKRFSDVISKDENGRILQWINFVQEGGGTLGISLVGYAFVLEYVGIRFLRIAGTSAGAINTLFLAAMGNKDEPKSAELYDMMMDNKRFSLKSFVDAKLGIVKKIIFSFTSGSNFLKNLAWFYGIIALLALIILPIFMAIGFSLKIAYFVFLAVFVFITVRVIILLYRFHKYNYGINPGKSFEEFLKKELEIFGIKNLKDLKSKSEGDFILNDKIFMSTKGGRVESLDNLSSLKNTVSDKKWYSDIYDEVLKKTDHNKFFEPNDSNFNQNPPNLYLIREEDSQDYNALTNKEKAHQKESIDKIGFDYSFVTTDIANQCKIVLPKDEKLYKFDPEGSPAVFVRASMAIPVFFEPKKIAVNNTSDWLKTKGFINLSTESIFIDGGSLSNFPINLFHNSHITEARVPIFGARIQDEKPVENKKLRLTFASYAFSILNTLRNNEDSSFLAINPFYKKFSIAEINTYDTKISWLNFALTKNEKRKLFLAGVEAALVFLEQFNWEVYKEERKKTL
ncbi:patatin-like phospholipase family protein [Flavobacterium sp. 22076]|jgi:NTE family protein|uniref:patatin-like phospholipase family protein n=1 Tax=unclassified Flavobacterium TaxID=196869 RepID=UPI003F866A03